MLLVKMSCYAHRNRSVGSTIRTWSVLDTTSMNDSNLSGMRFSRVTSILFLLVFCLTVLTSFATMGLVEFSSLDPKALILTDLRFLSIIIRHGQKMHRTWRFMKEHSEGM